MSAGEEIRRFIVVPHEKEVASPYEPRRVPDKEPDRKPQREKEKVNA